MKRTRAFFLSALYLVSAGCSNSELSSLVLEGQELHKSLVASELSEIRHISNALLEGNPYHSANAEFVEVVGRGSSQGQLDGEGVRVALFAQYTAEHDLGIYGLEFESEAAANRRESALRGVWAKNVRLNRARVHRGKLAVVVIWHDGVSPDCWHAVNAKIAERLR